MSSAAPHESPPPEAAVWTSAALADLEELCRAEGCEVRAQEPLARHTSIGVGGPTPLMVWPSHPEAVAATLQWCASHGLEWRVLSGGTNILVGDAGVAGPVVNVTRLTDGVRVDAPNVVFPAGLPTAQALRVAIREGLAGLVWSTGLPGTIGGAAAGNAGCWGGEAADVVTRLDVVDGEGKWRSFESSELSWAYRSVDLERTAGAGAVIVRVTMDLGEGDPAALQERSDELQRVKRERQPVGARNAGCIFKNPAPDTSAGQLIDEAGCKGMSVGRAEISTLHGNFLINRGGATAADVDQLIEAVTSGVRERCGASLEEEIRRW